MGRKYVLDGAIVQCSMGMKPAKLMVITNNKVKIQGKFKATDTDLLVPETFFQCKLKPTPSGAFLPCIPMLQKWQNTSTKTNLRGIQKFLFDDSYTMCMPGSRITIVNSMQINAAGAALEQYTNISTTIPGAMPLAGFDEGTLPEDDSSNGFLDGIQTVLDIAGLIPAFGEVADGINGLISLGRGNHADAALSFAAMLPIGGQAATVAKFGIKNADKVKVLKSPITKFGKLKEAYKYYKELGWSKNKIRGHLDGIDFDKPVDLVEIGKGKKISQWQADPKWKGNYFAESGTPPSKLGINPKGTNAKGEVIPKKEYKYEAKEDVTAIRSSSKPIEDTWSAKDKPFDAEGGGTQYFVGDKTKVD